MPNGEQIGKAFLFLQPLALKIKKLKEALPIINEKRGIVDNDFVAFNQEIKREHYWLGVLCILALLFDFWVSTQTFKPLAKLPNLKISSAVIALLFNMMDAIIAILASGVLVKSATLIGEIEHYHAKKKQKYIWLPILWSLCAIKIFLFVKFTNIVSTTGIKSYLMPIVIVALAILVYAILHFAGSGLYFIFKRVIFEYKFTFISPQNLLSELSRRNNELSLKCKQFDLDENSVRNYFNI